MRLLRALSIAVLAMILCVPAVQAEKGKHNFAGKPTTAAATQPGGNAARAWLSYYKGESNDVSYENISKFIANHPNFPAMDKLRAQAERAMPSMLSDKETMAWFTKNPPQTTFGMQMYMKALVNAGQLSKARLEINDWWKRASLTQADQSKGGAMFSKFIEKSAHQDRLRRLIYKEQYTNARALASSLGSGYSALVEARVALKSGNGNVNAWLAKVPSQLQNDEGLLYDRLVWRRKSDNDAGAIEILNKSPDSDGMYNPENWGKERAIIVRRLFEEGKYKQAYKISAEHKIEDGPGFAGNEWMAGWLALEYLNEPWKAFEHFERMFHTSESPLSKSRGAYWAGLASEHLGHPEVAQKWYDAGARYSTTFYGQLASQKAGHPDKIVSASVVSSPGMKNSDLASAARWLKQNGYKTEAGMFLTKMTEVSKTPGDFAAVAETANAMSMKNVAIKTAQECEKKTGTQLVSYAFPKIEKYMNDVDVEWALVHALVRQESRYDAEAVSTAGARGLMQLMPATAKEVAKKAGLSHDTAWLTSKPAHNVALGTRYLEKLLNRYDGNYAMALAAYNAGPGRVSQWINEIGDPRDPKVDLVNWIEMIPIYETRNYVQRVLEGVYVYRQTLSKNKGGRNGTTHIALQ